MYVLLFFLLKEQNQYYSNKGRNTIKEHQKLYNLVKLIIKQHILGLFIFHMNVNEFGC